MNSANMREFVHKQITGYFADLARTQCKDVGKVTYGCILSAASMAQCAGWLTEKERDEWIDRAKSLAEKFFAEIENEEQEEKKVFVPVLNRDYPELAEYIDNMKEMEDRFYNDVAEISAAYGQACEYVKVLKSLGIHEEHYNLPIQLSRRAVAIITRAYDEAIINAEERNMLISQFTFTDE